MLRGIWMRLRGLAGIQLSWFASMMMRCVSSLFYLLHFVGPALGESSSFKDLTNTCLQSEISLQVEDHLSSIAARHPTTRFVKLHYLEAELDVVSAPAILAYKEGELFANLVAVVGEIPRDTPLSESSLEGVLRK